MPGGAERHWSQATRALRVMIVQDRVDEELARALARHGHDVLSVAAGARAGRLLGVFDPEVIVVAAMGAGEVCRQMRRSAPRACIIALVPGDDVAERVISLEAGADDCLATPPDYGELEARLSAVRPAGAGPRPPVSCSSIQSETSGR